MDETAIFIPSLNRPHLIEALLANIEEVTPEPHKVYFVISDDKSENILKKHSIKYWRDDGGDTRYVIRMNFLYKNTTEPFMFMGSDDVIFKPNWLTAALEKMQEGYSVVVGDDLLNPNGTMALVRRSYIDELSGCIDIPRVLFNPNYYHNYADSEQFETAQKRGLFIRAPKSVVEHTHWSSGKSERDATYDLSNIHNMEDYELFQSRKHLWT